MRELAGQRKRNLVRYPDVELDREGRAPLRVRTPFETTINNDAQHGEIPMNVKRLFVATVGLSLGLASVQGGAMAQIKGAPIITGNVDGSCATAPSANSTGVNAGDWTITCGDLNPGAGMTVISPPSVASEPAPVMAPEPAPVVAP